MAIDACLQRKWERNIVKFGGDAISPSVKIESVNNCFRISGKMKIAWFVEKHFF